MLTAISILCGLTLLAMSLGRRSLTTGPRSEYGAVSQRWLMEYRSDESSPPR